MKESLNQYVSEISKTSLLSRKEEIELGRRVQKGDEAARDRMIRANLRLVVKIAYDYAGRGLAIEDLVAEGNRGMLSAVDRYDPERGVKFSVYAAYWIKQSILRALSNQSRTIRLPVHVVEKLAKIERARHAIRGEKQGEPTEGELAKATGLEVKKIRALELASQKLVPLDASAGDDETAPVAEIVPDESAVMPDEAASKNELLEGMDELIDVLDKRERKIIYERFGLGNRRRRTLEELGRKLGITRERVRQLQEAAIEKMRREMTNRDHPAIIAMRRREAEVAA